MHHVIDFLVSLPKEVAVTVAATLPILELRGAIPFGVYVLKMDIVKVYIFSLLGNIILVYPLLLFFDNFFHKLRKISIFNWWFNSVERRSQAVEKYGFWGLVLFVAIPLPVTGAWTGTVAATMFEIKPKKAFKAIFCGVAIAGIIVSLLVLGINYGASLYR